MSSPFFLMELKNVALRARSQHSEHLTTECPQIPVHIIPPLHSCPFFWKPKHLIHHLPKFPPKNAENTHLNDSTACREELSVGRILNISGQVEIWEGVIKWDPLWGGIKHCRIYGNFEGFPFLVVHEIWVGVI